MENRVNTNERRKLPSIEEYLQLHLPEYRRLASSMGVEHELSQEQLVTLFSFLSPITPESLWNGLSTNVVYICEQTNVPFAYIRTIIDSYVLDCLEQHRNDLYAHELFDYMNNVENGVNSRLMYVDRSNTASVADAFAGAFWLLERGSEVSEYVQLVLTQAMLSLSNLHTSVTYLPKARWRMHIAEVDNTLIEPDFEHIIADSQDLSTSELVFRLQILEGIIVTSRSAVSKEVIADIERSVSQAIQALRNLRTEPVVQIFADYIVDTIGDLPRSERGWQPSLYEYAPEDAALASKVREQCAAAEVQDHNRFTKLDTGHIAVWNDKSEITHIVVGERCVPIGDVLSHSRWVPQETTEDHRKEIGQLLALLHRYRFDAAVQAGIGVSVKALPFRAQIPLAESLLYADGDKLAQVKAIASKEGLNTAEVFSAWFGVIGDPGIEQDIIRFCVEAPAQTVNTVLEKYNAIVGAVDDLENTIVSYIGDVDTDEAAITSEILSRSNKKLRKAIHLALDGKPEEAFAYMEAVNAEVLLFAGVCKQVIHREGGVEKLKGVTIEKQTGGQLSESDKQQMQVMSYQNYGHLGTVVPDELKQKLHDGTYNDSDFYMVKHTVDDREQLLSFVRVDKPVGGERQVGSFNTHPEAQGVLLGQVTAYEVLAREGEQYTLVADVCVPTGLFEFYKTLGFEAVQEKNRDLGKVTLPFYDIVRPKGPFQRP